MNTDLVTAILHFLKEHPWSSSKEIFDANNSSPGSYSTVKRLITQLLHENLLVRKGAGKASIYACSPQYQLLYPIDINHYFEKEIDERVIQRAFNFELLSGVLPNATIFSNSETKQLDALQAEFRTKVIELSAKEYEKAMEHLAIDLSWKSSQIEGNTYSLLETERLLKDKITATGKTKDDAVMLLNHKEAIDFIVAERNYLTPLSLSKIEDIHSILIQELGVERNIRIRKVGISGTNYSPLDNEFQIKEAVTQMCDVINNKANIFEKALLGLVLLSYIQPFVDGNKRTARIISNAILFENGHCPLSFRTVDAIDYKKAMLIFYEQNNLQPMKEIFIDQYAFAVRTYF